MSWTAVRDTLATGLVTIGSHTHTHALLDRLPEERLDEELSRSTGAIEDHLGVTPEHFAYPKSVAPSAAADRAVHARFRSAALAGTRPNRYGRTDPYRLARSPIQAGDGLRWFRAKALGGMSFEDDVRRVLNRWRYSGADS
jgi:peptidoglycan/xylan/chitin deacetylase (PgdA/CDA1 family)